MAAHNQSLNKKKKVLLNVHTNQSKVWECTINEMVTAAQNSVCSYIKG